MRYVVEVLERYYVEVDADNAEKALNMAPVYCSFFNYSDSEARIVEALEDTDNAHE